jgi:hypothetical protein
MDDDNKSADDWGSVPNHYPQPRTLYVTKENKSIYLIVALALAATIVLSVIGIIVLGLYGKEIPSALIALGSVAVGALGSVFTHNK